MKFCCNFKAAIVRFLLSICIASASISNVCAEIPFTSAIDKTFQLFSRSQLPSTEEVDAFLKEIGTTDFAPATLIAVLSNTPSFVTNSEKTELHLKSMGLAGALVLNSKLNSDGGNNVSRNSAAKLVFNNSLQRMKFQSWYSAMIKQKALRYLVDSNQTTQSDRKTMYNDLVTNLAFASLNGNVPAAYHFLLNVSKYSNDVTLSKACVILAAAKVKAEKILAACSVSLTEQTKLQNQLIETLADAEIKQRRILSSKFYSYSSVMCTNHGPTIEDRLRCNTKLSASIELCRATDVSGEFKVLEGQFLCDKRALVSISETVDVFFSRVQSN